MTESLTALLEAARQRKARIDTAVATFRELPLEDRLHVLVTIEGDFAPGAVVPVRIQMPGITPASFAAAVEKRDIAATTPAAAKIPAAKKQRGYGPEVAAKVVALFDEGLQQQAIEKQMGLSYPTVAKMLRAAGRSRNKRTAVAPASDPEDSPRPAPRRLLAASEELDLARQLEGLEVDAWQYVLDTVASDREVADLIRGLEAVPNAASLRAADPQRRTLDAIIRLHPSPELDKLTAPARAIRNRFVEKNLGLVGMCANKFTWTGIARDDLMQEGAMGIMHAVGAFDWRRGLRFSTYSVHWIKHYMLRLSDNSGEVRVPVHVLEAKRRLFSAAKRLRKELRREPTKAEVAKAADVSLKKMHELASGGVKLTGSKVSIDAPMNEMGGTLGDTLTDDSPDAAAVLLAGERTAELAGALDKLPPIDADIIRRRFGIDCEPQMLKEIGEVYSVSRERIRQLEVRALNRLRGLVAA